MKTKRVAVTPYDSAWSADFEMIAREIENAVGDAAIGIEHVGSTSVAGMSAKPCIDIDVIIENREMLGEVIKRLSDVGYIHEGDLGIKDREAFRYTDKPHLREHHLYVCPRHSEELRRHTVFRDYLRGNPEAAKEYSLVKERAAELFPDDVDGYIEYKASCIEKLYEACGLKK